MGTTRQHSRSHQPTRTRTLIITLVGVACEGPFAQGETTGQESNATTAMTTSSPDADADADASTAASGSSEGPSRPVPPPFEPPEGCGDGVVVSGQYDCFVPISIDWVDAWPRALGGYDVDGDGREELVVFGDTANPKLMWYDERDGVQIGPVQPAFKGGIMSWRWDWNGDGLRDLTGLDFSETSQVRAAINLGNKNFAPDTLLIHEWPWDETNLWPTDGRGVPLDVDGDGAYEVVVSQRVNDVGQSNPPHEIVLRRQTGGAWATEGESFPFGGCGWLEAYALGDVDGDGDEDLVVLDASTGCDPFPHYYDPAWYRAGVFLANTEFGRIDLAGWVPLGGVPAASGIWVVDADGDGLLDIVVNVGGFGSPTTPSMMHGRGDGTFDDGVPVSPVAPLPEEFALKGRADVDGDGDEEWLAGGNGLSWVIDDLIELRATSFMMMRPPDDDWTHSISGWADFNGDGATDVIAHEKRTAQDGEPSMHLRYVLLTMP